MEENDAVFQEHLAFQKNTLPDYPFDPHKYITLESDSHAFHPDWINQKVEIMRTEITTNLVLIHRALVKDSKVESGLDIYDFSSYGQMSPEEKKKMAPFLEIQEYLMGLDSAAYEFGYTPYEMYEKYVYPQESVMHCDTKWIQLADDENIRIVGKSLSYDPAYQYDFAELNLSIENKTAQKLTVTNELLLVNGFDIMGTMYQEVEPGATVESSLSIDRDVLRRAEVPLIADLWVNFSVSSADYSLLMNTPLVKLRTDAPADFVQPLNESGVRLYDDHGVTVVARCLEPWYDTSAQLVLLIENKTDSYAYLATEGVRINGIDVDLFGNEFLSPQSNAISALYIDGDVLGAQNIQRVDAVSLQLTIQIHDAAYTESTTEFIDIPVMY